MKSPLAPCLAVVMAAASMEIAFADFVITHTGSNDPTTEGFPSFHIVDPSSTAGPIANDLGHDAWSIAGSGLSSQLLHLSGPLSVDQTNDIASKGFVLTFEARALQGLAPAYDTASHVTVAIAGLHTTAGRFDVVLGLDGNGDTVAALPTSIGFASGGAISSPGPSFTLTGSGSSYHTYQLVYDPVTELADLFIDGVERISDYGGHTSFAFDFGLVFGAISGGQGNFSFVELASVPEPSAFLLLGLVFLLGTVCHFVAAARRGNNSPCKD